jgi:hypothetical protein
MNYQKIDFSTTINFCHFFPKLLKKLTWIMKKSLLLLLMAFHFLVILQINTSIISVLNKTMVVHPTAQNLMTGFRRGFGMLPLKVLIAFDAYSIYTGVTGYCFFSPDPVAGGELLIQKQAPDKLLATARLEASNFEVANKFVTAHNYIMNVNVTHMSSDSITQLCVTSIAARLFEKYPNILSINVLSPAYELPCMADFSAGKEPYLKENSRYEFKKHF